MTLIVSLLVTLKGSLKGALFPTKNQTVKGTHGAWVETSGISVATRCAVLLPVSG